MLVALEAHLVTVLGESGSRGSITFLGTERVDVLRFGPDDDGVFRYVTLGMARAPMADPTDVVAGTDGPRAELLLSVRGQHDSLLRRLAVLAVSPAVEGLVVAPGASLDVGEPLWDGGKFSAVLVAEPGGHVPDLDPGDSLAPVRVLPLLPMTPTEAAWKRVHGADALTERWLAAGTDLRDPRRRAVDLT